MFLTFRPKDMERLPSQDNRPTRAKTMMQLIRRMRNASFRQSLLAEDKRVGIILQGRCRKILCDPLVNHNHCWTDAYLPTLRLFDIANGVGCHQKHHICVGLGTCLQTPGPGYGVVVIDDFRALYHLAFAITAAEDESRLYDIREDKNRLTMKFAQHHRSLALWERVGVRERSGARRHFIIRGGSARPMIVSRA
jgi:hypothetical protein